ncbi:MAG: type II secretion system protein [Candidatus Paceibacterota bacterium]
MSFKRGFTLIELLLVIAIIGILATLIITQLSGAQAKSRNAAAKSDISQMGKGIESWMVTTTVAVERAANSRATTTNVPLTRINGTGAGATCTVGVYTQNATCGGWASYFNSATGAYPVRISKTPSFAHTYGYASSVVIAPAAPPTVPFIASQVTSQNYCVGTSVTDSITAPDGAFYIKDGISTSKPAGTVTVDYVTGTAALPQTNPCS